MAKKSYKIAVVPGDGTGPEVIREALKVLNAAEKRFGFSLALTNYDLGAARYLRTGEILPASSSRSCAVSTRSSWAPSGTPTSRRASWRRGSCCRCASTWTCTSTCAR